MFYLKTKKKKDPLNLFNKFYINDISLSKTEKEILLFPYFPFKVKYVKPYPYYENNKH